MSQDASKRNYKAEYERDHKSPTAKKHRAMRNTARRRMKAAGADLTGKDVDHKRRLSANGSNSPKNLRAISIKLNRGRDNAATHKKRGRGNTK
jgi:hypothetical protein